MIGTKDKLKNKTLNMEQKLNSNSSAGAAADSNMQPIVIPLADIAVNPMLGDAYRVYKELSDGARLWFGTHRNCDMDFEKNIFSGWRPNAYMLSKKTAKEICQKYNAKMEAV